MLEVAGESRGQAGGRVAMPEVTGGGFQVLPNLDQFVKEEHGPEHPASQLPCVPPHLTVPSFRPTLSSLLSIYTQSSVTLDLYFDQ